MMAVYDYLYVILGSAVRHLFKHLILNQGLYLQLSNETSVSNVSRSLTF